MNIISASNPQWADATRTTINLNVEFGSVGTVPFTASASDIEAHGVDLFTRATAGEFGAIAAYVAPPVTVPHTVSMRQARLALLGAGLLTSVNDAVATMTGTTGDAARIEWEYAMDVVRTSPLVVNLSASLGLTEEQLDSLFTEAATL